MAFAITKSLVKVGIAGGAVFVSIDRGFWGNSDKSLAAYKELVAAIPIDVKPYLDSVKIENPLKDVHLLDASLKEYWNCGVFATFRGILAIPDTTVHYSKLAFEKASQLLNE